jgi:hypothetical protein
MPGEILSQLPGSAIPLTDQSFLRVAAYNSVLGADIYIDALVARNDLSLVRFNKTFVPGNARNNQVDFTKLGPGWLISLTARLRTIPVNRGQLWVNVAVEQGTALTGFINYPLFSDYLTSFHQLGWPPGQFKQSTEGRGYFTHTTGVDPAAGAEYTFTLPGNVMWRLHSVRCLFTADANVANRELYLQHTDGTDELWNSITATPIRANEAYVVNWVQGSAASLQSSSDLQIPMPVDIVSRFGYKFSINVNAVQVGDQISDVVFSHEELIHE